MNRIHKLDKDTTIIDNYTFFWNGFLSQWYPSKFEEDGIVFNCAEQYMMYHKAKFFDDESTANKILKSTSAAEQKKLGRAVKGFNQHYWNEVCYEIVVTGNVLKFSQNKELLNKLKETKGMLVEASPYDTIWGIGAAVETLHLTDRPNWGKNLLGQALFDVRFKLLGV